MKPVIYTSSLSTHHNTGVGHPENAERIEALEELFDAQGYEVKQAKPVELETVFLVHDEEYIYSLMDNTPDTGLFHLDGDTVLSPASYDAALMGAGAVCQAADDVVAGEAQAAFCAVRPPGHHAEINKAMGFCLMNNIFIGARYAMSKYNVKKVAIIDFDVHHGNGTDQMVRQYNDAHPKTPIFFASTHGNPLFPMTGDPKDNTEMVINQYLPAQCGSEAFRTIYEDHIFPVLKAYNPDILMLSSGFDAHEKDPLAQAKLKTEDYAWLASNLSDIVSNKNIISVLEGGYHVPSLVDSVKGHLENLT